MVFVRFCVLITKVLRDTSRSASSETQERSVGRGKMAAKVFKKARKSPWDATLNEPFPQSHLHKSKHTDLTYVILSWHEL